MPTEEEKKKHAEIQRASTKRKKERKKERKRSKH
jgi:hypothetical protein